MGVSGAEPDGFPAEIGLAFADKFLEKMHEVVANVFHHVEIFVC